MIAAAFVALLAHDVDVRGPVECPARADLDEALASVGGVDVAERVIVAVDDTDRVAAVADVTLDAAPRFRVHIDVDLANAEPLSRDVVIRPIECRDLPDLVALLVKQQRAAPIVRPRASPAPPEPSRHGDESGEVYPTPAPFEGPPACGATPFSTRDLRRSIAVSLAPSFTYVFAQRTKLDAMFGGRAAVDFTLHVDDALGVVVLAAARATPNGAVNGAFGAGLSQAHALDEGVVALLRGTLALGVGVGGLDEIPNDKRIEDHAVLEPALAGRLSFGSWFVETGAFVDVSAHVWPAPGAFLGVGFNVL